MRFLLKVIFALKGKFVLKLHFAYFALTNSSLCTLSKIYNESAHDIKKHFTLKVFFALKVHSALKAYFVDHALCT